jgi:hypothetical protein
MLVLALSIQIRSILYCGKRSVLRSAERLGLFTTGLTPSWVTCSHILYRWSADHQHLEGAPKFLYQIGTIRLASAKERIKITDLGRLRVS